jgi:sucrose-6-phosphate hydrolase SacC (GH32 family)
VIAVGLPNTSSKLARFTMAHACWVATVFSSSPSYAAEKLSIQFFPAFHFRPLSGWMNDPNGLFWDPQTKLYHMFCQYVGGTGHWQGNLSWYHAGISLGDSVAFSISYAHLL